MKTRAFEVLEALRTSFWFVPMIMVVGAVALSIGTIYVDITVNQAVIAKIGWLYAGGPEGARSVLAAIAGSMITVAGVVFSVTVVILSLASQQFGPRILRTFIRDRSNQFVLGSFVATFVYCLLVLRTVRGSSAHAEFVPHISVTTGIALAVLSIGVLIYFVHHAAESIQAPSIVAAVAVELDDAIDRIYPEAIGDAASPAVPVPLQPGDGVAVTSGTTGYVQLVEGEKLLKIASKEGLLIVVSALPGVFVTGDDSLATVSGRPQPDAALCDSIRGAFVVGHKRTATQDIDFLFRQLAEIAVRALSPGINDPFTAVECMDRVGAALRRLAGRAIPSAVRLDADREVRVVASPQPFAHVARLAVSSIRHYGESHEPVLTAVLRGIGGIGPDLRREEDRAVLLNEAEAALAAAARWTDEGAKRRVAQEFERTRQMLAPHS